jgi:DHA1 family tetracycline resistance protein-like MFS transporter
VRPAQTGKRGIVTEAAAAAEPHAPARPWKRALALVTVISLLNSMATMTVLPVLPNLVKSFTHSDSHALQYVGLFTAVFAAVQFFAAPALGSLSDAFGRRAVILLSALGLAADYLFMALAPSVGWRRPSGPAAGSASPRSPGHPAT